MRVAVDWHSSSLVVRLEPAGCHGIVVGLPVTQAGSLRQRDTDSQQGRRCRNFALNVAALAEGAGLHVVLVGASMHLVFT